jgi:hypothetical protein
MHHPLSYGPMLTAQWSEITLSPVQVCVLKQCVCCTTQVPEEEAHAVA